MPLRDGEILSRFEDLLKDSSQVEIATAWATCGEHLRILAEASKRAHRPVKVRAIVGTAGNATHPDALEELYRITNGDLRIIEGQERLFHPKLYLFSRATNGHIGLHALLGSANFTNAGFGGRDGAKNEEILVQMSPGRESEALDEWFRERWKRCPTDRPVEDVIRRYKESWKRNPPHRDLRRIVSGVSRRIDLLDDVNRPRTLEGYRQALKQCEEMLQDEGKGWKVLGHQDGSYMKAIYRRQELLLGEESWSRLDRDPRIQLKGGVRNTNSDWWGLLGRMSRSNWKAVRDHEDEIRLILDKVVSAHDTEFPDAAVAALQSLTRPNLKHGTATLLLTLARPDRLLSLNGPSAKAYSKISGNAYSTLGEPQNYRKLLQWLYAQPWYTESQLAGGELAQIWRFRAALVDAFAYESTEREPERELVE